MAKRGQLQISFGVIFSIIVIIFTLAVAGYIIIKFYDLGVSVSCKTYYQDLQEKIDKAWASQGEVRDVFSKGEPSGVKSICFGNMSQLSNAEDSDEFEDFKFYAKVDSDMFFSPRSVCDSGTFTYDLKHAKTDSFFCVNAGEGVKLTKGEFDSVVKLSG